MAISLLCSLRGKFVSYSVQSRAEGREIFPNAQIENLGGAKDDWVDG